MFKIKSVCVVTFVFSLFFYGIGYSQKENEIKANSLYLQAKDHFEKLEFDEALRKLDEAFNLFPIPLILFQKAKVYEKMGRIEDSYETLKSIKSNDPKIKKRVETEMKNTEAILAKPILVSIVTDVSGVEVKIDDKKELYKTPFDIELKRGKHKFVFYKPGFKRLEKQFEVKGIFPMVYKEKMEVLKGRYVIQTDSGSLGDLKILVDNNEMVLSENEQMGVQSNVREIQIGSHNLICKKDGYLPLITPFVVKEGEVANILCKFEKPPSIGIWPWVAAGGGAVFLGIGTLLLISYFNDKDELEKKPEGTKLESNKHIFGGMFLAMGIGAGVASYFLFTKKPSEEKSAKNSFSSPNVFSFTPVNKGFFFSSSLKF